MAKKKSATKPASKASQFAPATLEAAGESDAHKLERLQRWQTTMLQQMKTIDEQAGEVSRLTMETDELKKELNEAKNLHSGLIAELANMARDFAKGQERFRFEDERGDSGPQTKPLPFGDEREEYQDKLDGALHRIDCLSQTAMRKFHTEEFAAAKKREEPIGLAADKLTTLKDAGIKRIGDLEAEMRANPEHWGQKFGFTSHQQTIASNTLAVFRRKHPHRDDDDDSGPAETGAPRSTKWRG